MKQGSSIVIDPVTRIEGHSRSRSISTDGRSRRPFPRHQFRGFEKPARAVLLRDAVPHGAHLRHLSRQPFDCFCQGVNSLLAVRFLLPPTIAPHLRLGPGRSHAALSLFHLSSPDFSWHGCRSRDQNIFGVAEKNPELALDGIRLRQFALLSNAWEGSVSIPHGWSREASTNRSPSQS